MTYQITEIVNVSGASAAFTNPAPKSTAGQRDSRLILVGVYRPEKAPVINKYEGKLAPGVEDVYAKVVGKTLNIYTKLGNWCFWDSGHDHILGVRDGHNEELVKFYHGQGGNVVLSIDAKGNPEFDNAP